MAQIITKYSTSGGSSPSGLTTGELAVNILDKKLYVGGAAGTVSLSDSYVTSFNGVTGAVQGVSAANGLTGAVTWAAGTGAAAALPAPHARHAENKHRASCAAR